MQPKRVRDLTIVAAALLLLAVLTVLRSSRSAVQVSTPSTHDTGINGYAALYDLLAREGVRVDRFELPIGELPHGAGRLVIAGNGALASAAPSASALGVLDRWVRGGGRLVVLDGSIARAARRALGMPQMHRLPRRAPASTGCGFVRALRGARVAGTFTAGYPPACTASRATLLAAGSSAAAVFYRRGRGTIVLFATPSVFDNLHLSQRANARIAYAVLGGGRVTFDERVHGYAAGRSFWDVLPRPMHIAIALAVLAAVLGICGANLPFAPPYEAQAAEERDSGAYIASLARMLERGIASHEAIARIADRCEQVLSPRAAGDERARMLLRELRTLQSTPRPGTHELVYAGRIFARVRKDYGC